MTDEIVTVELTAGGVQQMSYRRAVSLVSRGLATWATQDTAAKDGARVPTTAKDEPQAPLQEPESDGKKASRKSKKELSAPAQQGQEGDDAENKPPTSE